MKHLLYCKDCDKTLEDCSCTDDTVNNFDLVVRALIKKISKSLLKR